MNLKGTRRKCEGNQLIKKSIYIYIHVIEYYKIYNSM